ncbi:MAG: hypothetical protein KAI79_02195 [Bacteroidales bacterium]|nr:hypothetical protein [Bacteroidales bacterium]
MKNKIIKYYDENNLGFTGNNKYDTSRYKLYKVFDKWYFNIEGELDFDKFLKDLNKVYHSLTYIYFINLESDDDKRSGFETYGFDNIEGDFAYICDRWNCSFRVRWMIDVLDRKFNNEIK